MNVHPLIETLSRLYDADRLLTRPAQLMAYESDALTAFQQKAAAVVIPQNREEVIETIRLCHGYNVPFVARGSGTSLSGGLTADR